MSEVYWYSTNGLVQSRLPSRHFDNLDHAFERRTRLQINDKEIFGADITVLANPYQGTMTAGNLHFGLYRNPPVWRISDVSLDTLTFLDESMFTDEVSETHNKEATKTKEDGTKNDQKRKTKILQRKRLMTESEENHICCCRIS